MNNALEHRGEFWLRELAVAGARRGFATVPGDALWQITGALKRRREESRRRWDRIARNVSTVALAYLYEAAIGPQVFRRRIKGDA